MAITTSIAQTSTATSQVSTTRNQQAASLDPNQFLKLLVAELQYQDPTKPMDTTQLVQQLSSLSQVQQTAQSNTTLASILDRLSLGQASSLVGRTITAADGQSSGVVDAVRVTTDGLVAQSANGGEIAVGPGVVIR
jgi:flagellar basal-body rod modification protein FlgD